MVFSMEDYLRHVSQEKLEAFLQDYLEGKLKEDFSHVIGAVSQEIMRRNLEKSLKGPDLAPKTE